MNSSGPRTAPKERRNERAETPTTDLRARSGGCGLTKRRNQNAATQTHSRLVTPQQYAVVNTVKSGRQVREIRQGHLLTIGSNKHVNINISKTKEIVFRRPNPKLDVYLPNLPHIERITEAKLIGVVFSSTLHF
jgi:hypothetical protein